VGVSVFERLRTVRIVVRGWLTAVMVGDGLRVIEGLRGM
jgi:hypothetical protein